MKRIFLAFCLLSTAQSAFADFCSEVGDGVPCTPDPGKETDEAKRAILDLIRKANKAEPDVKDLEAKYRAVRDNPNASAEQKFAACEPYRIAKTAQDQLYKDALTQTEDLYHVRPVRTSLTIAKPDDPVLNYTKGLPAVWNPQVTDSGPGVGLTIKIAGSDNLDHYGGSMMDPTLENAKQAVTFQDGRTMILKDSFDIALKSKNPGFLANLLYHEARHFNQLDRACLDDPDMRCGWASEEEDELSAYRAALKKARVFGLTKAQRDGLQESFDTYEMKVAHGRLTKLTDSPAVQDKLRVFYTAQINLEEEYAVLKKKIENASAEQLESQNREREERERQARRVEEERLAQERAALAAEQERDAAAMACGYIPAYQGNTGNFMGFKDDHDSLYFVMPLKVPIYMNDLRVAFLVDRACKDVKSQATPRACNDTARILSKHAAQSDFAAKLDYMLGPKERRGDCINHVFDQANNITDSASFEKVMAKYRKRKEKERREYDKRWRSDPPRSDERKPERERPPDGNDNNHFWDPSCNCWVRRY